MAQVLHSTLANHTSSSDNPASAGLGITGGYDGDSLTLKILIAFFLGLAMYNVVELQILLFGTFSRFHGLYFWSLVVASWGILPYSLGFLFKYFSVLTGAGKWFSIFLLSIGWYPMVTGQAIVLWSRLHLIVHGEKGEKVLRWTKWMIIVDAIVLHIPTTVLTVGSNSNTDTQTFVRGYNVMEKVQMCGFFVQEVILSTIYIVETVRILRLECASLYILETTTKPVFYSVKLKLEFAILGRLVQFVGGPRRNSNGPSLPSTHSREKRTPSGMVNFNNKDVSDFVDLTKVNSDLTRVPAEYRRYRSLSIPRDRDYLDLDLEIARLEHVHTLPSQLRRPNGHID
ncbi:hypothetical protein LTR10_020549 [Elasticomyces elasticus]|uniref:DUF7703 domain-containing protein n=1 Tax=Exophiala sideris TaxID=1016849 RepID=A0ABR0J4N0_9EURO|nr:hypothetical protein LTR10_020549 [Elasticomyces elasticus]KAK5027281.1 hypothetical protein LTS07_006881 [Exophiala sideris]KAK5056249.1 hypothetical protein LTR69_007788 [Exophiala sideris]